MLPPVSNTAIGVAMIRAAESARPDPVFTGSRRRGRLVDATRPGSPERPQRAVART